MPAPKMLAGLPKPVLFGLYGAIGGLLGALAFGELIWWVLAPAKAQTPPPPPPPEPRLALTATGALQIYQGGANKLFATILRDEFDDPVKLSVEGLPAGVTAADVTIPKGATEAEIEVRAGPSAAASPSTPIRVVASSSPGGKTVSATAQVNLVTLAAQLPQVDIVFVLDVTGSMEGQIRGLQNGIGTFAADLARAKVDARFGCVCFRDLFYKETNGDLSMEVLKFEGETFTSDARAFRDEVAKQRASGGDDIPETSFEAITEAANYKDWRKSASRVLILITDAPPKLEAKPPYPPGRSVKDTISSLSENKIDFLHLVIGDPKDPAITRRMQDYYRQVQKGAIGITNDKGVVDHGEEFDLPAVASNAKAFTDTLMPKMTKAIVAAAEAKRPDAKPELAKRPEAKPELAPRVKGVQSDATYDKSSSGQLVLAVGVWTGAIAALVCLFLLGGQHHYLRGTFPAVGGVLAGLVGGLFVGLVGGAAGQGLFLLADTDSKILEAIFRIMGWTILGSLAGLGLSLFVPNLKLVYGLTGGAVGGAVGAIGYIATEAVANAFIGRLAGGLVLGLFIGLMVAVVEAAFRRAWLEVRYGPREMVTVNLGAEPVKIGSDARACTVWARGAPEIALRYFIRDGKVICTDVPSRSEEVAADGDTREAGNVTVVVRTGSGAAPPSARPARPAPPPIPKAKPKPKPEPEPDEKPPLLDSFDDGLPMPSPVSPPTAPAPQPPAASVPRPPVPSAARPPAPAPAPPPRPAAPAPVAPAAKPAARDPNACPVCGRVNPGRLGTRYCMVCDQTY
jgi:hypothetical protein